MSDEDKTLQSSGTFVLFVLLLALIIGLTSQIPRYSSAQSVPTATTSASDKGYSSGSWGLGIVVPESANLSGRPLQWEQVTNITTEFQIPRINSTDNTIFAILSVVTESGSVLQVGAGLDPNQTSWLVYAMYIVNPNTVPQKYVPVLLWGEPRMNCGDTVSMSIFFRNETWSFTVHDISTNHFTALPFGQGITSALKIGDQEVFALESYTTSIHVFENMGNLTLYSILVDSRKVTSGWYYYGSWSGSHVPLLVVGGMNPPPFISVRDGSSVTSVWNYDGLKNMEGYQGVIDLRTLFSLILLLGWGALAATVIVVRRVNKGSGPKQEIV